MTQQIDVNKVLQVLVSGLEIAQKRGIYSFQESANINSALVALKTLTEQQNKKQTSKPKLQTINENGVEEI